MNTGGIAFPAPIFVTGCNNTVKQQPDGLTILDYFAAQAMMALLTHDREMRTIPADAYEIAETMLDEKNKQTEKPKQNDTELTNEFILSIPGVQCIGSWFEIPAYKQNIVITIIENEKNWNVCLNSTVHKELHHSTRWGEKIELPPIKTKQQLINLIELVRGTNEQCTP